MRRSLRRWRNSLRHGGRSGADSPRHIRQHIHKPVVASQSIGGLSRGHSVGGRGRRRVRGVAVGGESELHVRFGRRAHLLLQ